jgi:serine/threonine-protein kinase OSR1/STK39
MTDK